MNAESKSTLKLTCQSRKSELTLDQYAMLKILLDFFMMKWNNNNFLLNFFSANINTKFSFAHYNIVIYLYTR